MAKQPLYELYPNQGTFKVFINGKEPRAEDPEWHYDLRRRIQAVEVIYKLDEDTQMPIPPKARISVLDPEYGLLEYDWRGKQLEILMGYAGEPLIYFVGYPYTALTDFPDNTAVIHTVTAFGLGGWPKQTSGITTAGEVLDYPLPTLMLPEAERKAWMDAFLPKAAVGVETWQDTPISLGTPIGSMSVNKLIETLNKVHSLKFIVPEGSDPDYWLKQYLKKLKQKFPEEYGKVRDDYADVWIGELRPGEALPLPLRTSTEQTDLTYLQNILRAIEGYRQMACGADSSTDNKNECDPMEEWTIDEDIDGIYFGRKKDIPFYIKSLVVPVFGYRTHNYACLKATVQFVEPEVSAKKSGILNALTGGFLEASVGTTPATKPAEELDLSELGKAYPKGPLPADIAKREKDKLTDSALIRFVDVSPDGRMYIQQLAEYWRGVNDNLLIEATLVGYPIKAGQLIGIIGLPAASPIGIEPESEKQYPQKVPYSRVYRVIEATHHINSEGFFSTKIRGTGNFQDEWDQEIDKLAAAPKILTSKGTEVTTQLEEEIKKLFLGG